MGGTSLGKESKEWPAVTGVRSQWAPSVTWVLHTVHDHQVRG